MSGYLWLLVFVITFGVLSYHRASLIVWTISFSILMVLMTCLSTVGWFGLTVLWLLFIALMMVLNVLPWRRRFISRRLLIYYKKVMPSMSRTEREALAAGTVTWEGDLFRGAPRWDQLLKLPKPALTVEEQAFVDGPVEQLCAMINDWDITHNRADLPPEMWQFLKEQGFFSLIIPRSYGGKEFSAYAHSQILIKVYSLSVTVASTIAVPNSLGPAELILRYGTEEQKNFYLPRLARGDEMPCFALTGPDAGSDAGAMPDTGEVCMGMHDGKKVLGIRLNFSKRYITLAPIATVIGLAFKLLDPEHLLGKTVNLGITCALIPRDTPNMEIGQRHFPLNVVFQNGPIHGKNVFIPIEWIIGGPKMVGQGWRMLMECLATGRAISLPASSTGGAKMLTYATGAYARIRRQFNVPIGYFEGVEAVLGRIAGHTYMIDAARSFVIAAIDAGAEPAIASAIIKYHTTELGRRVGNDAMDVHGGKGICLGPKNYIGRGYESIPISITVEGANILTRNMIIFGQGAMRCHPYIFSELQAAKLDDERESLVAFDKAIIGHMSFTISNFVRSLWLSLTSGIFCRAPAGKTKRYFKQATRFSAAFALVADLSLIMIGGALKRRENISARLGDILSYLYLLSATLKHYYDQGSLDEDWPLVRYTSETYLYEIQQAFNDFFQNFPNKWVALLLRLIIFPFGRNFSKSSDKVLFKLAQLIMAPTDARSRVSAGIYTAATEHNPVATVQEALVKSILSEPVEKILQQAVRDKLISGMTLTELASAAFKQLIISKDQLNLVVQAERARHIVIAVDDFSNEELARVIVSNEK
ncbi:MAG: acyl-CoA dehydrogenase [Pseudomonadota bacterium]